MLVYAELRSVILQCQLPECSYPPRLSILLHIPNQCLALRPFCESCFIFFSDRCHYIAIGWAGPPYVDQADFKFVEIQ